jgi:hypothetical protein
MAGNTLNGSNDLNNLVCDDDGLQVELPSTEKHIYSPEYEGRQSTTYQKGEVDSKPITVDDGKQVQDGFDGQHGPEVDRREEAPQRKRQLNRRRLYLGLIAGILSLILIVVAVVIAVLVTRDHSSNKQTASSPTTTAPSPITTAASPITTETSTSPKTTGAFKQTGLAAMDPLNAQDAAWLISQSYTGSIQLSTLPSGGTWQPHVDLELNDAANGTSIEAISYITANQIFVSSSERSYRHVQL